MTSEPAPKPDNRRGILHVDLDMLTVALGLPTGSRILAVRDEEPWRGSIEFLVWHEDLPSTPDGHEYPIIDVVVRREVQWKIHGEGLTPAREPEGQ